MAKSSFPVFAVLAISVLAAASTTAEAADNCLSGLRSSAGSIPFNTSSVTCATVWKDEDYQLAYEKNGTVWNFVLSAPDNKVYVGLGFSDNGMMAGASALVGWIASNGSGIAWQYYLGGFTPQGVVPNAGNLTLFGGRPTIVSVSQRLYMAFRLQIQDGEEPKTKLILSHGPDGFVPTSDFRLTKHAMAFNTTIKYVTGSTDSPSGSPPSATPGSPPPPGRSLAGKLNHDGFVATFFGSVAVYLAMRLL